MATSKQYIGSGKATKFNGVSVTLRMEDLMKHVFETERGTYVNFIVSPRKETNERGQTHNAFVLVDIEEGTPSVPEMNQPAQVMAEPAAAPAPKKERRLRRISKEVAAKLRAEKANA